jgi:hypothetical protein
MWYPVRMRRSITRWTTVWRFISVLQLSLASRCIPERSTDPMLASYRERGWMKTSIWAYKLVRHSSLLRVKQNYIHCAHENRRVNSRPKKSNLMIYNLVCLSSRKIFTVFIFKNCWYQNIIKWNSWCFDFFFKKILSQITIIYINYVIPPFFKFAKNYY